MSSLMAPTGTTIFPNQDWTDGNGVDAAGSGVVVDLDLLPDYLAPYLAASGHATPPANHLTFPISPGTHQTTTAPTSAGPGGLPHKSHSSTPTAATTGDDDIPASKSVTAASAGGKKTWASEKDWDGHRTTITRLYVDENKRLWQIVDYMEKEHGFYAT